MTHWERIRAALKGAETDRVPISLWRHWPIDDETPENLAAATVRWQRSYDFDLVKITPTGTYGIEDWGARTVYNANYEGVRTIIQFAVTSAEQWPRLKPLDVTKGFIGSQLKAVRMVAEELRGQVPILMTIFGPLTTARKLAGDRIFADLRCRPEVFKQGLQTIAETTTRFCEEAIRAGANGLFYATQGDSYRLLNEAEYREFGEHYDRMVLNALRSQAEIIVAHAHGEDIMFDIVASYPADAINWHDRTMWPSLTEARPRFSGMLVGGVNEWKTLVHGPVSAIEAEIKDAMAQCGERRYMVGPGCVIPVNTPSDHVRAARNTVEKAAS